MKTLLKKFNKITIILLLVFCGNINAQQCSIIASTSSLSQTCGTGALNNCGGILYIGNGTDAMTWTINTVIDLSCLGPIQLIVRNAARIYFTASNRLTLATGTSISFEGTGTLVGGSCNASERIYIGTDLIASCNGSGSGADFAFPTLVSAGGFNIVKITPTSSSACGSRSFTLTATATPSTATEVRWYSVASGGTPLQTTSGNNSTYITPTITSTTTYYAEATIGTLITPRKSVTVTINPLPTVTLSSNDADNIFCAGTSVRFSATGGTNYNFRVGGATVQNGASATYTTTSLTNGQVVDVIVTNSSGCTTTSSGISNTVNALPTAVAGGSQSICTNTTATVSGATATNGTIAWTENGAGSITSGATTLTPVYTPALADAGNTVTLTMTVTSNNTCAPQTATAIYTVTVNSLVDNTSDGFRSSSFCIGNQSTITFDANNLSGKLPYTIVYRNDTTLATYSVTITNDDPTIINLNPNPTVTTDYRLLSITDANGCVNTSPSDFSARATINPLPATPTITASGSTTFCAGGSVTLTSSVGTGYLWSNGATTQSIGPTSGGSYTVQVSNSNGCFSPASSATVVTVNTLPNSPLVTTSQPTCSTATGTITITAVAGETYSFDGGSYSGTLVYNGLAIGTSHTIFAKNSLDCVSATSANVTITPLVTKTWDGVSWLPVGNPTSNNFVIIDANYNTSTHGDLNACSLTVNLGKTLTITPGGNVIIQNDLTVNASATLDILDKGSLVMINDSGIVTNNGTTYVRRSTTPFKKFDYVYWSTPVTTSSIVNTFQSIGWNTNRAYEYIPGNDWSFASTMSPGKGYIIMVPTPTSSPGTDTSNVVFSGEVNNGDKIKITGVIPNSSYLLGNPYPSAINADKFLDDNSAVLDGTLYFWTHNTAIQLASNIDPGKAGSGALAFTSNDYATYNRTGGVATAAAISPGLNTSIPTGEIASGQGFFGSSKVTLGSVKEIVYNNSMRLAGTISGGIGINEQFFKTSNTKSKTASVLEKHRIWLELKNSQGAFKQTLVGYITGATNDYDSRFDGESFDGNDFVDFYSIYQNKNLTIQGRALPFDENDTVILGFKSTIDGSFTINIGQVDGLLINQAIYLEDKLTNTIFDLKTGNYTFTTAKGTFNNRFVLRYTNDKTLGIGDMDKDDGILVFYSNNYKTLIIKNNSDAIINSVALFNMAGQNSTNWNSIDGEQTNIHIPIKNASSGAYIVKITTTKGEISKKIIIK